MQSILERPQLSQPGAGVRSAEYERFFPIRRLLRWNGPYQIGEHVGIYPKVVVVLPWRAVTAVRTYALVRRQ